VLVVAALVGCAAPAPPPEVTPTPAPAATPAPTRPIAVAVRAGSPTPTVEIQGDFASNVKPTLLAIQDDFKRLEAQLAAATKAPQIMAQDDWRNQLLGIAQDLLVASTNLRSLSARITTPSPLKPQVQKLTDDVDFVGNEFRMALDYDPDSTHMIRAARAEKTTRAEVDSLLDQLH